MIAERDKYRVEPIDYETVKNWILKLHYAKRIPSISHSFGLFLDNVLVGIVTYGMPASPFLCKGVCGEIYKNIVLELNRLVLLNNIKNEASLLIGRSLKQLPQPSIVVSYADTKWNHIGFVYQATNWIYTGITKERTDIFSSAGHSRHHNGDSSVRQGRSAKHRYVFFVGDKRQRANMLSALNYRIEPYPKGDSLMYEIDKNELESVPMLLF